MSARTNSGTVYFVFVIVVVVFVFVVAVAVVSILGPFSHPFLSYSQLGVCSELQKTGRAYYSEPTIIIAVPPPETVLRLSYRARDCRPVFE